MKHYHLALLGGLVAASLHTFIQKHFSESPILLAYNERFDLIDHDLSFTRDKILFNVSIPLNEFDSKLLHRRVNYLLIVKDVENLVFVIKKLTLNENCNTKEKYLVLMEKNLDTKQLEYCFALLWQYDIYNVVVTTRNNTSFSTWYPYAKKSRCGNTVVTVANAIAPFSNKIPSRFTNCKVTLMWKYYPVLTTNPKEKPPGMINQMLLLLGKSMGLTIHFQHRENQLIYEEVFNRTLTKRLAEYTTKNKIDIVANMYGSIATMYLDKPLEASTPFTVHEDMWLLPPKQPLPSVEAFLSALTIPQYFLISATFLSFMFAWRLVASNSFDAIRIFLQQPIHGTTNNTKKVLLIFGLFFTIHVWFLYSSQLIRVLYRPVYPSSYKTLEEVLDKTDLKFSYPSYAGNILQGKDVNLWKRVKARTEEVLVSRIYTSEERKKRFLYLEGVLEIGSFDLYYIHNPQDLEILEEQVSL